MPRPTQFRARRAAIQKSRRSRSRGTWGIFRRSINSPSITAATMAVVPRSRPSWGQMSYGKGPFPREFFTKLTYGENRVLTCTSGAITTYQYAMNDCFDPNVTGTGHQPRFFDTLCGADNTSAPYQRFQVYKAKITVTSTQTSSPDTVSGGNMVVGLIATPNSSIGIPTSIDEMIERNDAKYYGLTYLNANRGQVKNSKWADVANVLGLRRIEDGGDDTTGTYAVSPALRPCFTIFQQPMDTSGTGTLIHQVQLEMWVRFYYMNDVSDS